MLMAHQLDGLVLVPNCDKIVPGMVMAAVRMDVPAVVCSGGPMMAGTYGGEEVSLSKMFEAVGDYLSNAVLETETFCVRPVSYTHLVRCGWSAR